MEILSKKDVITIAFIHGDNQYGYERAFALLKEEGFILEDSDEEFRCREEVPLVHIGDNGDYYRNTTLRDQKSWEVLHEFYDEMLIGNHEAAVLFGMELGGFWSPSHICKDIIHATFASGKLKFATSYDGFLITHAGVHPNFEDDLPEDPVKAAEQLNELGRENPHAQIFAFIGAIRGGWQSYGGIFWRDADEALSEKWPQIFGHSRLPIPQTFNVNSENVSYGIDVGYPDNGRIAGIYTHNCKIVEVNLNK